jgi:hypothetical protein
VTVVGTTVLGTTVAAALLALAVPGPAAATTGASRAAPAATGTPPPAPMAGGAVTAAAGVRAPRCTPGDLSASLALSVQGTTLAGAVIFSDTGHGACTLRGTPAVTATATGGGVVDVVEQRAAVRRTEPVVLAPGGHGNGGPAGTLAGVSVTWSEWRCTPGSFSLDVRFPGWSRPVVAPYGTPAAGGAAACTASGPQTLYVGPVTRLRG